MTKKKREERSFGSFQRRNVLMNELFEKVFYKEKVTGVRRGRSFWRVLIS